MEIRNRYALIGILAVLFIAIIDRALLAGELLLEEHVAYSTAVSIDIPDEGLGIPYVVRMRYFSKTRLGVELLDPEEKQIYSYLDLHESDSKDFKFTPQRAGRYQLKMEAYQVIPIDSIAWVRIYKNDRSILPNFTVLMNWFM